jgi:hypothetical protein
MKFYFGFENFPKGTARGNIVQEKKKKTFVNFVNKLFRRQNRYKFGRLRSGIAFKTNYNLLLLAFFIKFDGASQAYTQVRFFDK